MENKKPVMPEDDEPMPRSVYHLSELTTEDELKIKALKERMQSLSREERRAWLGWPTNGSDEKNK